MVFIQCLIEIFWCSTPLAFTWYSVASGSFTAFANGFYSFTQFSPNGCEYWLVSTYEVYMWETICDVQAGFCTNSKLVSKFYREPISGISDQRAPPPRKWKLSRFGVGEFVCGQRWSGLVVCAGHRHCACKQGTCSAMVELFTGDAINRVFTKLPKLAILAFLYCLNMRMS